MGGLRAIIEADQYEILEGDFGLPVELISPAGVRQTLSANNPTELLQGMVVYCTVNLDAITGEETVVGNPSVTLRTSSMDTVPAESNLERWICRIPESVLDGAPMVSHKIGGAAPVSGKSYGRITYFLERIAQSS